MEQLVSKWMLGLGVCVKWKKYHEGMEVQGMRQFGKLLQVHLLLYMGGSIRIWNLEYIQIGWFRAADKME